MDPDEVRQIAAVIQSQIPGLTGFLSFNGLQVAADGCLLASVSTVKFVGHATGQKHPLLLNLSTGPTSFAALATDIATRPSGQTFVTI
jgi:hypothetical protein